MSPDGVVALVTGGGSGLGRATALGLHAAGASVVSFDRSHEGLLSEDGIHLIDGDVA